jgi:pimeloyl-ACP methyl ester carboxylesterase
MAASPTGVLLPGWGAPARFYDRGLPPGWKALELPRFGRSDGSFGFYRDWVVDELSRLEPPIRLGGHSMGGALAIAAAAADPERYGRLVLISPAGLPISKPISRIVLDFWRTVASRRFPAGPLLAGVAAALSAPRPALSLARAVRVLDLSPEMRIVREQGVPSTVVGCRTDTLITPASCRLVADELGARYRELDLEGGHLWVLSHWSLFEQELERELGAAASEGSTTAGSTSLAERRT